MYIRIHKAISIVVLVAFILTSVRNPAYAQEAQQTIMPWMPRPGAMVYLSLPLDPPALKGIKVHADNPLRFDFILDKGESQLSNDRLKEESNKLIKYFLASLTIPENDLWVNLSPYEKDRIIPDTFGLTEMGRDLLAEDYVLKQITASLIYPENEIGKKFWKRVYEEAQKKYGTTNIPVNTFNKVWIVPDKAIVYENAKTGTAYVAESKLKVMLEEDYLALEKNRRQPEDMALAVSPSMLPSDSALNAKAPQEKHHNASQATNALASQIVREIVIPQLTQEINKGKNFAPLRQIYASVVLAAWYKRRIKDSIFNRVYIDRNKIAGVDINDPLAKEKIYERYLQAFKKGAFNFIKEDLDPSTQEMVPRKYFSGGASFGFKQINEAMVVRPIENPLPNFQNYYEIDADFNFSRENRRTFLKKSILLATAIGISLNDILGKSSNKIKNYPDTKESIVGLKYPLPPFSSIKELGERNPEVAEALAQWNNFRGSPNNHDTNIFILPKDSNQYNAVLDQLKKLNDVLKKHNVLLLPSHSNKNYYECYIHETLDFKVGAITKRQVEKAGLNWNNVSQKLIENGWGWQSNSNEAYVLTPDFDQEKDRLLKDEKFSTIWPILGQSQGLKIFYILPLNPEQKSLELDYDQVPNFQDGLPLTIEIQEMEDIAVTPIVEWAVGLRKGKHKFSQDLTLRQWPKRIIDLEQFRDSIKRITAIRAYYRCLGNEGIPMDCFPLILSPTPLFFFIDLWHKAEKNKERGVHSEDVYIQEQMIQKANKKNANDFINYLLHLNKAEAEQTVQLLALKVFISATHRAFFDYLTIKAGSSLIPDSLKSLQEQESVFLLDTTLEEIAVKNPKTNFSIVNAIANYSLDKLEVDATRKGPDVVGIDDKQRFLKMFTDSQATKHIETKISIFCAVWSDLKLPYNKRISETELLEAINAGIDIFNRFIIMARLKHKMLTLKQVHLKTNAISANQAMSSETGGINLTTGKINLELDDTNGGIWLDVSPAMIAQLEGASGCVPVITGIRPLASLNEFMEKP